MTTLYAQYGTSGSPVADNYAPGGHSPDTIWNTQADGNGAWAAPQSGDTLDANGRYVNFSVAAGYPGAAGTTYTITDSALAPGMYRVAVNFTATAKLVISAGGRVATNASRNVNGVVIVSGPGAELFIGDNSNCYAVVAVSSGGKMTLYGRAAATKAVLVLAGGWLFVDDAYGPGSLVLVEAGGVLSGEGSTQVPTIICRGGVVDYTGGDMAFCYAESGSQCSIQNLTGFFTVESGAEGFVAGTNNGVYQYHTGATVSAGKGATALGTERRTTRYTGQLADIIQIIGEGKTLVEIAGQSALAALPPPAQVEYGYDYGFLQRQFTGELLAKSPGGLLRMTPD